MKRPLTLLILPLALGAFLYVSAQAQTRRSAAQPARPAAARPQPTPAKTGPTAPAATRASATNTNVDAGALPDLLAVVNGVRITSADLSAETQEQVRQLEQQMATERMHELDLEINQKLLDAEAKRRGLPADKIYETEVNAKVAQPTDTEVQTFFDQNKAGIEGQVGHPVELKDVREQIVSLLLNQRRQQQEDTFSAQLRTGAQYQVLVTEITPSNTPAERARVVATVNGQPITAGSIEDAVRPLVVRLRDQIYQLRANDLEIRINDTLLQQEAQRRQITPEALLDSELKTRMKPVSDAQAQAFYTQNKARINGEFAQVKEQVLAYLTEQARSEASGAFADELRRKANVQTFLKPPVVQIAIDDQPMRGGPNAAVTIVEFADFQCPSCAAEQPVIERIMNDYGDRVRLVARDFPLTQHKNAFKAAEAAEAAREQGKYWEYAALLFKMQAAAAKPEEKEAALAVPKLKEYASQLGLDRTKFDAALDSGRFAEKVRRDQQDGVKIGINATPSLYVNGRIVTDFSYEGLKSALDDALRTVARK